MARKRKAPTPSAPAPGPAPAPPEEQPAQTIHRATLGDAGRVYRHEAISEDEAALERRAGRDVVVCGAGAGNHGTARRIETAANGRARACPPHDRAGPYALPHFQPDPRPPEGHTFYEAGNRRAFGAR